MGPRRLFAPSAGGVQIGSTPEPLRFRPGGRENPPPFQVDSLPPARSSSLSPLAFCSEPLLVESSTGSTLPQGRLASSSAGCKNITPSTLVQPSLAANDGSHSPHHDYSRPHIIPTHSRVPLVSPFLLPARLSHSNPHQRQRARPRAAPLQHRLSTISTTLPIAQSIAREPGTRSKTRAVPSTRAAVHRRRRHRSILLLFVLRLGLRRAFAFPLRLAPSRRLLPPPRPLPLPPLLAPLSLARKVLPLLLPLRLLPIPPSPLTLSRPQLRPQEPRQAAQPMRLLGLPLCPRRRRRRRPLRSSNR